MRRLHAHPTIEIGQCFRPIGGTGAWAVVGFYVDHSGNPHARIEFARDRTRVITIALAALRDRRLYRRLHESEMHDDHASSRWAAPKRADPGEPA